MHRYLTFGFAMIVGAMLGALAVNSLHAQGKTPGAYTILDVKRDILDANTVKQIVAKAASSVKAEQWPISRAN